MTRWNPAVGWLGSPPRRSGTRVSRWRASAPRKAANRLLPRRDLLDIRIVEQRENEMLDGHIFEPALARIRIGELDAFFEFLRNHSPLALRARRAAGEAGAAREGRPFACFLFHCRRSHCRRSKRRLILTQSRARQAPLQAV